VAKEIRKEKIQKVLIKYKFRSTPTISGVDILTLFQKKPIRISKLAFLKFNGKLMQNKNILLGFNPRPNIAPVSFLQCYKERRF